MIIKIKIKKNNYLTNLNLMNKIYKKTLKIQFIKLIKRNH